MFYKDISNDIMELRREIAGLSDRLSNRFKQNKAESNEYISWHSFIQTLKDVADELDNIFLSYESDEMALQRVHKLYDFYSKSVADSSLVDNPTKRGQYQAQKYVIHKIEKLLKENEIQMAIR
jgi:hypothetical protein